MTTTADLQRRFARFEKPSRADPEWRHLTIPDHQNAYQALADVHYDASLSKRLSIAQRTPSSVSTHSQMQALNELFAREQASLSLSDGFEELNVSMRGHGSALPRLHISASDLNVSAFVHFQTATLRPSIVSGVITIDAAEHSQAVIALDISADAGINNYYFVNITCQRSSSLTFLPIVTGAGNARVEITLAMLGENASAEVLGLDIVSGVGEHAIITSQDHVAGNAVSRVEVRTILYDKSRAVYHGLISVQEGANGTDAYQKNAVLLLSPLAKAHTTPKLEIQANDVRCTHGASSGPLDQEALFYLQSRGLRVGQAKQLLIRSFALAHLTGVKSKAVAKCIEKSMAKAIAHA